ncbi:hypothetical protein L1987_64502 [Smallanthus sonchifolius]|uniref:Uncharacterized protein n=1 Tax=Smallanthus sonchifolius TaxID=185202 RepID=A0ACB9CG78_9ASTR|nr:hypothetical protein L1987_64502 [Smallanthus sonchifolius]
MWKPEKEITELVTNLIEKIKNTKQNLNILLATLMSPSKKDDMLDLKEIVDECKTFYIAGKETTANLLKWVFLLLGLHQEWQNKARDEVDRVCGQHAFPSAANLAELKIGPNLQFIQTFSLETGSKFESRAVPVPPMPFRNRKIG